MGDRELQVAILKTIVFFDAFDYPLTTLEVYKFLYQPFGEVSFGEVREALAGMPIDLVEYQNGTYFLPGRKSIVSVRQRRYRLAVKKYRKALLAARLLSYHPGVLLAGACNNIGYNNVSQEGDIDFFIVCRSGRLWLSRFLITGLFSLLRLRRHGQKITDRICLSFYVSKDTLDLSSIALQPEDIYLKYWLSTLMPLSGHHCYNKIMSVNNWLVKSLPNYYPVNPPNYRSVVDNKISRTWRQFWLPVFTGPIGGYGEQLARRLQEKHLRDYLGETLNHSDHHAVISADMLKLHKTDRRAFYYELWRKKVDAIIPKI